MIRLLMFDAFRTIFDTYGTHTESTRRMLQNENSDIPFEVFHKKWDALIIEQWRTPGEFKLLWPIFEDCLVETFEYFGMKNYDAPGGIKLWLDLVAEAPPFPETAGVVGPLLSRYKNCIVSNSDNFEMKLCLDRLGLKFDAVFTSEDVKSYKPRPKLFNAALEHFGLAACDAVMIGDSLSADIQGARNAGIRSIWINRTGKALTPEMPQPDYTLPDLSGLPEIISFL